MKKIKKQALSIVFFSYFTWGYLLKQKEEVVQTPEQKFKENIARNATFEGYQSQTFAQIMSKIAKN